MSRRGLPQEQDDDLFTSSRSSSNNYGGSGYGGNAPRYDASTPSREQVQAQIEDSRTRTIESQQRALRSLYQSEKIGVDTAEELLDQGEKLRRTERRLDEIAEMQKTTNRQINSLSSVFGGIKNWWAPKPKTPVESEKPVASMPVGKPESSARLAETIRENAKKQPAPASEFDSNGSVQKQAAAPTQYQKAFDSNLDEMGSVLGRIKTLAVGLEGELKTQNSDLDRMGNKMESVQSTMRVQDRQLNTILYGKK